MWIGGRNRKARYRRCPGRASCLDISLDTNQKGLQESIVLRISLFAKKLGWDSSQYLRMGVYNKRN